jgi:hypothetical protein
MSGFWHRAFRVQYRILALIDRPVRIVWRRFGVGNVVELRVARRGGRGFRSRLIGLLRVGERRYFGHPDGDVGWTRDLEAAGGGTYRWPEGTDYSFRAVRLSAGPERDEAIRATNQHPFPGNLVYRLGRRHVRAAGVFFRLEA